MKSSDLKKNLRELETRIFLIYLVALVFFLGLSIFANQILREQAASQATSFIKRMVKLGDFKEIIITLSQAKLPHFNGVVYYDNQNTQVFSLPADLDPQILNQSRVTNQFLYGYINSELYFDQNSKNKLGNIIFIYDRFSYVNIVMGIWLFLVILSMPLIRSSRKAVIMRYEKDLQINIELARAELARKVRHDIRSPLFSLQGFLAATKSLSSNERRVLDRIVNRVFGIIADLEEVPNTALSDLSNYTSVSEIIKEVVKEKQLQQRGHIEMLCQFEPTEFLSYTGLNRVQLSRVISNVLDNSIEAQEGSGKIIVSLRVALGTNMIRITDTGKGIPSDILPKIFDKNFSFNKPNGSGIGLSSAKEFIEIMGHGKISATSKEEIGTEISIELPVKNYPSWWLDRIKIQGIDQVAILDDQETSHDAWRMKLKGIIKCIHFTRADEFALWLKNNEGLNMLYLIDFDLGKGKTGIEIITGFNIMNKSILVTGNYDDPKIQASCESLMLKLLPKPLIAEIPII